MLRPNHSVLRIRVTLACLLFAASPVRAADWPMWRCDAARSAASTGQLPDAMTLLWTREFAPRKQTWDDPLNRDLMTYDRVFEPVVKDGRLFLGFNDQDRLAAYDVETGTELWSYFADGPVRLAPVAWKDRVYFASDDGYLYCLKAADGTLIWRFRGGPNERQILGNQRLVSAWPMRGGPVIRDGQVYVAASIWPFMGTFIYALDAEAGRVTWVNDETGAQYIKQPHSASAFAGIAPQGALVATSEVLLVPGGRSVPAAFDRRTGKQLYFEINAGGKGSGGSFVAANEESWFVHTREMGTREFALKTGVKTAFLPRSPVLAGDRIYSTATVKDQQVIRAVESTSKKLVWEFPADGRGDLILSGNTLYAAGRSGSADNSPSVLTAIRLPDADRQPVVTWTATVPGSVERLIAATGKLFAVTLEGRVMAFGAGASRSTTILKEPIRPLAPETKAAGAVEELLQAGAAEGYSLWLGAADEPLVTALAVRSPFVELTIVDEDSRRVGNLRRSLVAAGKYPGVTARRSALSEFLPPPYLANMLFVGRELTPAVVSDDRLLARLYESVRPFGGVLYLLAAPEEITAIQRRVADRNLEQAAVEVTASGIVVRRVGPLPGAGGWTHQHGNIANTIKSDDRRVKLPMGVLWFGGSNHNDVLPRHGHGPPEQVLGGRLFIEGMNSLTARDVYTGRELWKRQFKNLGTHDVYFDDTYKDTPLDPSYNQVHIPGANARGTNYVVTADRVYIVEGAVCHVLDTATGKTLTEIALPQTDPGRPNEWGYIGVYEDVLIGGVGFARYRSRDAVDTSVDLKLSRNGAGFGTKSLDRAASLALVGFDRHSGRPLWKVDARHSFWHNAIVAGGDRVYALDKNPKPVEDFLRRRGKSDPVTYRILAFDAQTGQTEWELPGKVFGTWLGYSEAHDLLLQAGAAGSDRLSAEVAQGMAVYRGKTGELVWSKDDLKYTGPCVLHNDLIITNVNSNAQSAGAFHLIDGTQKMVKNPLTGQLQPWAITRAYGCGGIIASENLLTFRSGAAGFFDLLTDGGTGNFGGFRSGCSANLIVADGVLNAPDYTRTCSCAYQNQTSLALVHMPEMDAWTNCNALEMSPSSGPVRQLGVNLGAPGDRRDPHGLMWLESPTVAGDSPEFGVEVEGQPRWFQDHPTALAGAELPWVASSGVEGLTSLRMSLKSMYLLPSGIPVDHADDDAEETGDGAVNLGSSTLGLAGTSEQDLVGLRFNGITLARGAEIKSASLQLTCRSESDVPTRLEIFAEASGNAGRFRSTPRDLSSRRRTAASVQWTVPAWKKSGESSTPQQSPDLAPLIREVVGREDWRPGNSIVLLVQGAGKRDAAAFGVRGSNPARLRVDARITRPDPAPGPTASLQPYRVRLYFGVPRSSAGERREFDVALQNQVINVVLDGANDRACVHTIDRVLLGDRVEFTFTAKKGQPVVSGIEFQRLVE